MTVKDFAASDVAAPTVSDEDVSFTMSSGLESDPFDQSDEVVRSIDLLGRSQTQPKDSDEQAADQNG